MWVLSNSSSSPLGVILPYAASIAPEGWVICDGKELSRDEYSDLFSLIDTTYGSGNGSSTFNIPNLSGRVPVGIDIDGNTVSNGVELGNYGGEQTHTLLIDEMPNHSHGYTAPINSGNASGQNTIPVGTTNNLTYQETEPIGGDQPHNNMQPYLVTNYIIRVVGEIDPNIDGVNQIPPLEEILELQHKVDSLEEVLGNDNFIGFTSVVANENDSTYITAIPNSSIVLTGQISSCYPQSQSIDIIFDNENFNKENNIKGGGWLMPIENGSSISNSNLFYPLDDFPTTSAGWTRKFYYEFEVSHPMEIIIYSTNSCGNASYTIQH